MTFDKLVEEYQTRFSENDSFVLHKGEKLSERIKEAKVPNKPGVYIIYRKKGTFREVLCIGKGGTLRKDGTFSDQKLLGRLEKGKQNRIPRRRFFQEKMETLGLDELEFRWFVTFSENTKIIPAKAEADLIQAYYTQHKKLPDWNEEF